MKLLSPAQLFVIPWTVAYQAPLSMGFSRQEYWSGLLCPSPGDLHNPGIEPRSPALQADALPTELQGKLVAFLGFPGGSEGKAYACNAGDPGSISELGRSPGEGNGNPRQYSCLENPMDGGAW